LDEKGSERTGNDKYQYRKSNKNLDAESFIKAFQKTQFHLFFPNSAIRGTDIVATNLNRDNFRYFGSTVAGHIHELWKALFCPVRDIRK
jgi:hypothetical protein